MSKYPGKSQAMMLVNLNKNADIAICYYGD
jgi:hypothetical protein